MNRVILTGRLTRDPEELNTAIKFTLAVDKFSGGEKSADFISVITFGKTSDLVKEYLSKGSKVLVEGRISTGSYTNKEGSKVYTTDVIADRIEFLEPKKVQEQTAPAAADESFMTLPDDADDTLPFT